MIFEKSPRIPNGELILITGALSTDGSLKDDSFYKTCFMNDLFVGRKAKKHDEFLRQFENGYEVML